MTVALIGWSALNVAAFLGQGTFSISQSVAWTGGPISISVDSGDMTITPSTDGRVHVVGIVHYSLVKPSLVVKTVGSNAMVSFSCPAIAAGRCSAEITVSVPPGATLLASSQSGNVMASGLPNASLESDSGDVRVSGLSGNIRLQTHSGDIVATGVSASSVVADDDSGTVELDFVNVPESVDVQDSSGDVRVLVPAVAGSGIAYHVTAQSDSGTVSVAVPTDPESQHVINVSVASGDVGVDPS
jgi:putative adhesin